MPDYMTLKNVAVFYRLLYEKIMEQGGEITPEQERELSGYEDTITNKVDALRAIMKAAKKNADFYKEEAQDYVNVSRSYRNTENNARRLIVEGMTEAGVKEAGTIPMVIRKASKPSFEWDDLTEPIPTELRKVTIELDKTKAYQSWKLGFLPKTVKVNQKTFVQEKHRTKKEEDIDE